MTDTCVYGAPPVALAEVPPGARQASPLVPGAAALEDFAPASLSAAVIAAPPGTIERRYVLALALRALQPGASLTALAHKEKGGSRLRKELEGFGCSVEEVGRHHQRICHVVRPQAAEGLEAAIAAGGPQRVSGGLWSQPGVFSWDRDDLGSQALIAALPPLAGHGADLGCGIGVLARAVLASPKATRLDLVDLDRRAIEAARRNIEDPRAQFHWADVRRGPELSGLDFVVTNPPFHDTGLEDKALGQAFIRRAHGMLRPGGALWLVANRHLPYEAVLGEAFAKVLPRGEGGAFKIYEARR
ncbi:MAG TPA: class I SAM-dependent methyltransferase [Phenylobacterium sp.]|uniref:class I SAM-dependent methyltransferase n=1 Tax=Phenylobacterium sp. TaxID=1871053 RepID=UPI002B47CBF0|nr:class I SAM-dependent methyltransferase [Phenylobacterium sp.]HKR88214.1 class I SAM-dependent methyltransferase [Phenylobacterium sp.]